MPGQELERAAADVSREAGKSLLRGLARLFGARFAVWLAKNEAEAKAARMAIETTASIAKSRALTEERRRLELEELEHEEKKALAQSKKRRGAELEEIQHEETKALAHRRLNRLLIEMAREQANFEAIASESIRQIEHDPNGDKPRDIEDDWIWKFARLAQDISDNELQRLWANILRSAAIEGRQLVSAAALQSMSLLDRKAAEDFEKFLRAYRTFGFYPGHPQAFENESQAINLGILQEIGLIGHDISATPYSFAEFDMRLEGARTLFYDRMLLTQRGTQIANALFCDPDIRLSDELEVKYLKDVISNHLAHRNVTIFPKVDGKHIEYMLVVNKMGVPAPPGRVEFPVDERLPGQLRRIIEWIAENYAISRMPGPHAARSG